MGVEPGTVEQSVRDILTYYGLEYEGTQETPRRVAKMYSELLSGYNVDIDALFTSFEPEGYKELVLVRDIPFYSMCEHHMLPFHGVAHVGYIPGDRIVGLSKLARLVEAYAHRLQVQERMTMQIADTMVEKLQAASVMVVIAAEHLCMTMRGVQKPGSVTVTSAVRGDFLNDPAARAEYLALLRGQ